MSDIPGAVQIGPLTYRIIVDTAEVKAFSDRNAVSGEWLAFSDHDKLIIGINPDRAADANRVDLVHEILHCAVRASGAHPGTYADTVYEARDRDGGFGVEEYTVAAMAGPLLSTLRDNPGLVAYLTAARKGE